MRNINKLNSKLQYESFAYKLNDFLVKQSLLGMQYDNLDELFHTDFETYVNAIIEICMVHNHLIPNNIVDEFICFVKDNFDIIKFDNIDSNHRTNSFFARYILNVNELHSNFNMFLYTIKFVGIHDLNIYLDVFIKYNILTKNQLDKIFMYIANYMDVKPNFISKYIKYFATPRNAYVLKLYNKHFYDCGDSIVNKLTKLANKHIYGESYNGK